MSTIMQRRAGDFDLLRREMEALASSLFQDASSAAGWTPRADVVEMSNAYSLALDLPGVSSDSLDLTVHDGMLKVSGERQVPEAHREGRFHRVERSHGRFARQFRLGSDIDPDTVEATFENGVLMVSVRKAEEAQPRRIEVRSGQSQPELVEAENGR